MTSIAKQRIYAKVPIMFCAVLVDDWKYETESDESSTEGHAIHLKGQMMFMPDWAAIMFLGTPM